MEQWDSWGPTFHQIRGQIFFETKVWSRWSSRKAQISIYIYTHIKYIFSIYVDIYVDIDIIHMNIVCVYTHMQICIHRCIKNRRIYLLKHIQIWTCHVYIISPCFAMVQNAHVFADLQSRRAGIQHEQLHHHPAFRVARKFSRKTHETYGSGTGQ